MRRVPGLTAEGVQAALRNRLVPLVQIGSPPISGSTVTSGTGGYGSWAQLIAATSEDWWGFRAYTNGLGELYTSGGNSPCLLDIGTGAAASETVLIGGIDISNRDADARGGRGHVVDVPYLFIPKDTRIAARISSSTTSRYASQFTVNGYKPASQNLLPPPLRSAVPLVTPSSQRGVPVAPGTSWTEIVASTSFPFSGLVLGLGSNDTSTATAVRLFDVAFGAAGSETLVWSAITGFTTSEQFFLAESFIPLRVPAGTRICARMQTENVSVTLHGLN